MKKYICFIVLLGAIAGCTKEAPIKLPEQVEKLVVTCFISPEDTMLTAVVRTSSPKFSSRNSNFEFDVLSTAEVRISSSQGTVVLPFVPDYNCYAIEAGKFPIVAGGSYTINVTAADGKQTSASTTIPNDTLTIRSHDLLLQFSEDSLRLEVSSSAEIADLPGQTNYVGMYYRSQIFWNDTSWQYDNYQNYGYGTFEDDEKQSRQSYVFQQRDGSFEFGRKDDFGGMSSEFWALNCSKEFYLYNRSVNRASSVGDNPFGDPVQVYTNMSNGFGCFGGFRVSKRFILR